MFEIETCTKEKIADHAVLLENWMRRDYIHYPYLWVPAPGETSLDLFIHEESALLTLLKQENRIIGVAAGLAFEAKNLANLFSAPLAQLAEEQGIRPETLYYMSFFLTDPDYRNEQAIIEAIYDAQVKHAKFLNKTHICFWTALDIPNHPLKPNVFIPVEPWGYAIESYQPMHIELNLSWSTLQVDGSVQEEVHPVQFFMKML
jgi:hypothetical protein